MRIPIAASRSAEHPKIVGGDMLNPRARAARQTAAGRNSFSPWQPEPGKSMWATVSGSVKRCRIFAACQHVYAESAEMRMP